MGRGHGPSAHGSIRPPFAHRPSFGPQHGGPGTAPHGPLPFDRLDANSDGKVTKDEVMQVFAKVDADGDGSITKDEMLKSIHSAISQRPGVGFSPKSDRPAGPPAARGGDGVGRPPFGGGPMGRGPQSGGPRGASPSGAAGRLGPPSTSFLLERFDKNKDGKLTKSELPEFIWDRLSKADANSDGEITKDEIEAHLKSVLPDGTSKPEGRAPADKPAAPEAAKEAKSA